MDFSNNILVILLVMFLFSCGNKDKTQDEIQKDWKTFETEDFSIKYPHKWELNQSGYQGTSFLLISKQTSIRDFYQENVSLVEEEVSDEVNLLKYVKNDMEKLKSEIVDCQILENSANETETGTFHKIIYSGREQNHKVTVEKYYFVKSKKAYVLTFAAKSLEIKRYRPIGEGILNSFVLK